MRNYSKGTLIKSRNAVMEKPLLMTIAFCVIITGALTITSFSQRSTTPTSILCTLVNSYGGGSGGGTNVNDKATPTHLAAILHYATSRVTAQQSLPEVRLTFDVLRSIAPCNFLVFGIGHDSLMWSSFNPGGTTLFLEDDVSWVQRTLSTAPSLRVRSVNYATHLSDADDLLSSYKSLQHCLPPDVYLKGNRRCTLALSDLPEEVYAKDWDVIMIDGPRGYYAEAPGRMSVIFTVAVMARARSSSGMTHIFLHDVDRKVEKEYAEEFLCTKYRVRAQGKLWHFQIPPASRMTTEFC